MSAFVFYEIFGIPGSFAQSFVGMWSPTEAQVEVPSLSIALSALSKTRIQ